MTDKFNKFMASLYLAVIGDKIGFGNGLRERNYTDEPINVEAISNYKEYCSNLSILITYRFIAEGGILGINLSNLNISDDTIMHLETLKGLIYPYSNRDELYQIITQNYLMAFTDVQKMRDIYLAGRQTLEAIKNINSGVNWKNFSYSKSAGGSGGPMRTMVIGLAFYQDHSLLKLIESSIMICSITHPNSMAFIGSIVSALFTSYALKDMNIEMWIFELISLLESDQIDNIIERIKPTYLEYFAEDKKVFLHKLATYVETSFNEYNYIISERAPRGIYPSKRFEYYFDNFSTNRKIVFPGSGADDCVIIAYDCLLLSKSNYEKLIYTSMINIGDSDTIGTIASAWYGALYGFNGVPTNLILESDEYYILMKDYTKTIYEKYYDKSIKNF